MSVGLKGIVGAAFVLLSGPFLLFSVGGLGKIAWLALTGEVTTGVVSTSDSRSGGSRGTSAVPVVSFIDESGQTRQVSGTIGLRKSLNGRQRLTHAIGTEVRLVHPAGKPEEAVFADGKTIAWMTFTALFVALFPALGIWLIRSDRREMREQGMFR